MAGFKLFVGVTDAMSSIWGVRQLGGKDLQGLLLEGTRLRAPFLNGDHSSGAG